MIRVFNVIRSIGTVHLENLHGRIKDSLNTKLHYFASVNKFRLPSKGKLFITCQAAANDTEMLD